MPQCRGYLSTMINKTGWEEEFLLFPSSFSTVSQHLHTRSDKCTPRNTIKTWVICPKAIDRRDMGKEQQRFYYIGSSCCHCPGKPTVISTTFSKENSQCLGSFGIGATRSYGIFLNRLQKIWVKGGHNLKNVLVPKTVTGYLLVGTCPFHSLYNPI